MAQRSSHWMTSLAERRGPTAAIAGTDEEWLHERLALAADWRWSIDPELATIAITATADRGGPHGKPPCTLALPGEFVDMAHEPEAWNALASTMRERSPFRMRVFRQALEDGCHRFVQLSGFPVLDHDGAFAGYRGVARDVTAEHAAIAEERRLADEQRQQLAWFRQAIDEVGHSVVIFDQEGRLVTCNKFYRDGYRAGDRTLPADIRLEGKTFRELMELRVRYKLHKEFADEPEKFIADRMSRFESETDHTVYLANGTIARAQYRQLADGVRVYVGTDITEIMAAEQKRRDLELQLHHQHSQKLESLGTLAGGVAHELNNALVPILALTKVTLRRLPEGSRERNHLDTVVKASERARDLVRQILIFSRKEEARLQVFDLGAVVGEAMKMLRAVIPTTIMIDVALEKVPPVLGDAGQWHQVLANLVSNAAKAIGMAQGRISVELAPAADGLRLIVADTGCGMAEAIRSRIFEPFFTTRQVGEGTGLGLSVVHGIVIGHGGRIALESAPGEGARFIIHIPAAEAGAEGGADAISGASE
jgi:signal transduction histidine kinase